MEKFSTEFDDYTGVVTEHGFNENKLIIAKKIDLAPLMEYTNTLRNSDEYSKQGIKRGFFHVATLDPIAQHEMLKMGIDIYRASTKELLTALRRMNKENFITTRKQV